MPQEKIPSSLISLLRYGQRGRGRVRLKSCQKRNIKNWSPTLLQGVMLSVNADIMAWGVHSHWSDWLGCMIHGLALEPVSGSEAWQLAVNMGGHSRSTPGPYSGQEAVQWSSDQHTHQCQQMHLPMALPCSPAVSPGTSSLKSKFTGPVRKLRDRALVCWFMEVNSQLCFYMIGHNFEQNWISRLRYVKNVPSSVIRNEKDMIYDFASLFLVFKRELLIPPL